MTNKVDEEDYDCPLCGEENPDKKRFSSDLFRPSLSNPEVNLPGFSIKPGLSIGNGSNWDTPFYYACTGCGNEYVDISTIGIESTLKQKISTTRDFDDNFHYIYSYSGLDYTKLILRHRTGVIRFKESVGDTLKRKNPFRKEGTRPINKYIIICLKHKDTRAFIQMETVHDEKKRVTHVLKGIFESGPGVKVNWL